MRVKRYDLCYAWNSLSSKYFSVFVKRLGRAPAFFANQAYYQENKGEAAGAPPHFGNDSLFHLVGGVEAGAAAGSSAGFGPTLTGLAVVDVALFGRPSVAADLTTSLLAKVSIKVNCPKT